MRRWTNPLSWSGHSVGMLAFLALFPGFFFYHALLGLGQIGAVLGGYFAPVSLLVAGPLAFFYAYKVRREANRPGTAEVFFLLFLAYFLTLVGIHAAAGANATIVTGHLLGALFIINLFFIFRLTDFSRRDVRVAAIASLAGIVFAFSVDGAFYLAPMGTAKNPESLATYQGFSRSYLLTFMVVITACRSLPLRMLVYAIGAPTLFLNAARTEFVALLFLIPLVEFYFAQRKLLLVAALAIVLAVLALYLDALLALLPNNRILELLDLSHSTSANKRHHLTMYAMNTISQFPVFGDYGSYTPGFYSHNMLSAWVDTGLFGFLFLLALMLLPTLTMLVRGYFRSRPSTVFLLPFTLACVTLLLLATSHYFTDMLIGATLGAYSTYRYGRKHAPHRPPHFGPSAPRHAHLRQTVPPPGPARV